MIYDVTFKRMSETLPTHLVHVCKDIETAVRLTREQYPGCLIFNVTKIES